MNITLTVVVAAIVILITALVVITIFGSAIGNVATIAEGSTYCRTVYETSCKTTNSAPLSWKVNVNGAVKECTELLNTCSCNNYVVGGCTPIA